MSELLFADSLNVVFKKCKQAKRVVIGYSGGVDSHVLLHFCATIPEFKSKLLAVYVHHGLQVEADTWAVHCKNVALGLSVEFKMLRVNALPGQGESPEEAARDARYAAFKTLVNDGDVLLVAQHREDQLETVLLQLFRGSGLKGLSGMPESIAFGKGWLLRPFLTVSKRAINFYAVENGLTWVTDPSNYSNDYDRNFLRNEVLPLIKQHWPSCETTVSRSAKHCAEAQIYLSEQAEKLLCEVFDQVDKTLLISNLLHLDVFKQELVIREWFKYLGYKMPSTDFVKRLRTEVAMARQGSDPVLAGRGYSVRRYRDKLYCLKNECLGSFQDFVWLAGELSVKISEHYFLDVVPAESGISWEKWSGAVVTVRSRKGGEKLCLANRAGRHTLKDLFQEAGVPSWEREMTPLVYLDDRLVAVGDRWVSADFFLVDPGFACVQLVFRKD